LGRRATCDPVTLRAPLATDSRNLASAAVIGTTITSPAKQSGNAVKGIYTPAVVAVLVTITLASRISIATYHRMFGVVSHSDLSASAHQAVRETNPSTRDATADRESSSRSGHPTDRQVAPSGSDGAQSRRPHRQKAPAAHYACRVARACSIHQDCGVVFGSC